MNTEQIIRQYLPQIVHMSLATSKDNAPWVCEVHFAYDNDLNIYFRSLPSRRHSQEIAASPRVAGNIVRQHALGEMPVGVYFEGTAKLLGAGEEQATARTCLQERLQLSDKLLDDAQRPDGHQFYKISVSTFYVFGKFDDNGAQKFELPWNGGQK
ncbi:MAG: hypothetical protein JWN01_687 [Patescibacteria group bacterium]|nr:hypothetical protein [Patescibacteria group bacterium]